MAQRLAARDSIPELIVTSSATRALMTAEYVRDNIGSDDIELAVETSFYLASPSRIVSVLRSLDSTLKHVMVIAHNPGLEELSALLTGESPMHFPTAAIRQFACPPWSQLVINHDQHLSQGHNPIDHSPNQSPIELIHSDFPKNIPE
jgi:phosphohistidine phosphatase